jgi:hypothetical protein
MPNCLLLRKYYFCFMRPFLLLILALQLLCLPNLQAQSRNAMLHGKITDETGKPVELANIALKNTSIGTYTDKKGEFLLQIPAQKTVTIVISIVGFQTIEKIIRAKEDEQIELNSTLARSEQQIDEVQITQMRRNKTNMNRIDSKFISHVTNAGTGGVEALIKTLPGVSTNNELSSQYSVRGGNFDENLVYINDVEIYRPMLTKSGQQEGMSMINSDMVSSIEFSAGGFDAKYGDKMSSVLDIKYRRPTEFGGSATASMLGGTIHIEDLSKNGKFSHISGFRYKTNRYLLGTLDDKGDYNPSFTDFQTYLTYKFSDAFDISFLGNLGRNNYNFIPQTRETSFGTITQLYKATIYYEGQEKDKYTTTLGALIANYHPNPKLNLKFITSAFKSKEAETYDILGQYYIKELDEIETSSSDSTLTTGVDTFLNHARNYLNATVYSFEHKGAVNSDKNLLNWGIKFQKENIDDRMNEWVLRDSTGYSIPYVTDNLELYSSIQMNYAMNSNRLTAFVQDTYQIPTGKGTLYVTGGVRSHYWSYSDEFLVSPRAAIQFYPEWNSNLAFHLSGGIYDQPPFYKELKDRKGVIYPDTKAQRSVQVVMGSDYIFKAWDRPFKFSSEIYYKYFSNLIPYQIDNVRIKYMPDQKATGYATGIDMKVNGEFVSGVESWASLSIMKTQQDVLNDGHGFIPRPTDQLINFSVFFQDYFPGNPSWKMNLTAFYGSGLPVGPPNSQPYQDVFRIPAYQRVDLGFSKVLISPNHKTFSHKAFDHIKDMWLDLEVFNLLDISNTISYLWVSNNQGDMFAVPNYLTRRKVNLKLTVKF